MSKLVIFPGQGAQYAGMAKDLYDNNEEARQQLDEIFEYASADLKTIMFEDDDSLNETRYTHPAMLAPSVAVLAATGIKGDYLLGHSLGELPALVPAGVVRLSDGVRLVEKRGAVKRQ